MSKVLSQKSDLGLKNYNDVLPSISPQEQKKLFQKMERYPKNNLEIRNEIVEKNMGLIDFWARKIKRSYPISSLEFKDIYQAGAIGLMRAVDRFKWRKGYRFSTFAIHWINQAMTKTINNQSNTISIPVHKTEIIIQYKRTKKELCQELGRSPSIQEIAIRMDVNIAKINHLDEIRNPLSLEIPFPGENESNTLIDVIEDKKIIHPLVRLEREDLRKELTKALFYLDSRERKILILRFGLKNGKRYTLEKVGKIIGGISDERVRQIEVVALRKIRKILESK